MSKQRRILHDFTIDEISAVDRPAQERARVAITKGKQRSVLTRVAEIPLEDGSVLHVAKQTYDESREAEPPRKEQPRKEEPAAAFKSFDDAVAHFRTTGLDSTSAMRKARTVFPELLAKYQARDAQPAPVVKAKAAVRDFHRLVDGIAARDKVPRDVAMRLARKAHPDEFVAYQEA